MALSISQSLSLSPTFTSSSSEFANTPRWAPSISEALSWTDGTGSGESNRLWGDEQRSISAASNDDLDLAGGLTDVFGNTITMARVKMIYIKNRDTTAGKVLRVGAAGTNPISTLFGATPDYLIIPPSGYLWLATGDATAWALTAGSADVLRIANPNASSIEYDILLVGSSA